MEEVTLTEPETRFYSELFLCCDVEKTGKVPMLKATELFRSADIANEAVIEITALAGIPSAALHISRAQFYSCLKLIAAHQAAMPLRQELIAATVQLPLPHFSWKDTPTSNTCENGLGVLPPPPPTDRRNSLRRNSQQTAEQQQLQQDASDVPSTDSEVEQNESSCGGEFDEVAGAASGVVVTSNSSREKRRRGVGASPEAWSTNSDSPTPTNSVAERHWVQDTLWHGLLGDEHRQLLGTEEESSDRHSSDDDDNESELVTLYQITPEQRDYYFKQFKAVQRDPHGLLSGHAARIFFEKSRIPVEELRHIWQLCDVTRDGALSLSEFTAAMHLVVLRRNNIPLPTSLPHCLHPNVLQAAHMAQQHIPQEPPEADLLHLNDDDEDEHTDNTIISANLSGGSAKARPVVPNDKNIMNLSSISTSSQASNSSRREVTPPTSVLPPPVKNRSISNSPNVDKDKVSTSATAVTATDGTTASNQWTKFSESPTTTATTTTAATTASATAPAVSSPGLKPALFDMKRTAQDVGSNPQILHPVPLRVTPIGTAIAAADSTSAQALNDNEGAVVPRETSPKAISGAAAPAANNNNSAAIQSNSSLRDSLQSNDLRAIQRPQAKKLPVKNIGALPPPPQRESSVGSTGQNEPPETAAPPVTMAYAGSAKKEPPPLPPPRPHRHARSSSLDLNKFKMGTTGTQQAELDAAEQQQHSLPPVPPPPAGTEAAGTAGVVPPTRISLHTQRVSAFEVYRKPNTPRNSLSPPAAPPQCTTSTAPTQPPPPAPFGSLGATAIAQAPQLPSAENFDRRVTAISDSLRHVSFKNQTTTTELLHRLREQNNSLLHLCNDLSDELLSVQTRKEEMRLKLESIANSSNTGSNSEAAVAPAARTVSSISAPVTANVTGGSSGSGGAYTNV